MPSKLPPWFEKGRRGKRELISPEAPEAPEAPKASETPKASKNFLILPTTAKLRVAALMGIERFVSNQEGFSGGFVAGALIGGLLGGVLGAALTSRRTNTTDELKFRDDRLSDGDSQDLKFQGEEGIEAARQVLEVKIAQLNAAIDDVRHQLHSVNGNASGTIADLSTPEEN